MIHWFAIIGLLLDLFGGLMLWEYGLPSKIERLEVNMILEQDNPEAKQIQENNQHIIKRAKIGLSMVIAGFALQLTGVIISYFRDMMPKGTRQKANNNTT